MIPPAQSVAPPVAIPESPKPLERFAELHRRVSVTAGARFQASRRLARQAKFAQWTIALLSVVLVFVSLVPALGLPTEISTPYLNAIQVGLAVLVLVYSLLIGMDNYSVRADKMHRCGMELGRVERKLQTFLTREGTDANYESLSEQYFEILNQYENHEDVDYGFQQLTALRKKHKEFFSKPYWNEVLPVAVSTYVRYWVGFSHYVILSLIVVYAFWRVAA
jgi:hypothetical protein